MTGPLKAGFAAQLPNGAVEWQPQRIKPQWYHPLLEVKAPLPQPLPVNGLQAFAYDFYLRFLPFFRNRPEGTLSPGTSIEFTRRMTQKLGLALLFERKIRLNEVYFANDPALLPYTLFHEMIHLWLYDCNFDPGHTKRFYHKMEEFRATGLPIDESVHVHSRIVPDSRFVYQCPNCMNRWYLREALKTSIYCGHCHDKDKSEHYPKRIQGIGVRAGGRIRVSSPGA